MDSVPTNIGRWAMGDGVFAVLVGKRTIDSRSLGWLHVMREPRVGEGQVLIVEQEPGQ